MSGAIIPDPLAKPLMVIGVPAIVVRRVASLRKVSVVRMARAAASQVPGASAATARGRPSRIFSAAGGSPMTPVDEMKTSRGLQPSSFAVAFRGRLDDLAPQTAGEGVRVAGICDDGARLAAGQRIAAPKDRRAAGHRTG